MPLEVEEGSIGTRLIKDRQRVLPSSLQRQSLERVKVTSQPLLQVVGVEVEQDSVLHLTARVIKRLPKPGKEIHGLRTKGSAGKGLRDRRLAFSRSRA